MHQQRLYNAHLPRTANQAKNKEFDTSPKGKPPLIVALTCCSTSTLLGAQLVAPFAVRMGVLGRISWVSSVFGSRVHSSVLWSVVSWLPSRFETKNSLCSSGSHTGPCKHSFKSHP